MDLLQLYLYLRTETLKDHRYVYYFSNPIKRDRIRNELTSPEDFQAVYL